MRTTVEKELQKLNPKAPRVDKYEGHQCAVDGCLRTTRAMSRWCYRHAQQHFRTRHPEGRMPRKKELTPYRDLAAYALREYGIDKHPSWLQARQIVEGWVAGHAAMSEPYRKHFRRMHEGGATGPAMMLNVLSVYGLRYLGVPDSYTDDAVFFSCLGSRFLRSVSLGGYTREDGKRVSPELNGLTCEALGRALAERVGVFALTFWRRVEREQSWREASLREMEKAVQDLKRQGTPSAT